MKNDTCRGADFQIVRSPACRWLRLLAFVGIFGGLHVALDVQTHRFVGGIAAHGDHLGELTGILAATIVNHLDFTALAGSDGFLRVGRNGATARSESLFDYERTIAGIFELKGEGLRFFFGEFAEVVLGLVKSHDTLSECRHGAECEGTDEGN